VFYDGQHRRLESEYAAYLDVAHLNLLLFESVSRLAFAVVECAVNLLAPALDLLTDAVVFALLFAQLAILVIALLLQLSSIVSMQLAQLLGSCTKDLERVGELSNESASELFVFGGAGFEGA
jgi:hypothetical protein